MPQDLTEELDHVFGEVALTELKHANQFNVTWLMDTRGVVKRYRWLTPKQVDEVLLAEALVASAGVPVPPVLHRCEDGVTVVYARAGGEHRIVSGELVDECAALFMRQLAALEDFVPSWQTPRPVAMPLRARKALAGCATPRLADMLSAAWTELRRLAETEPTTASHVDWRADNILFEEDRVTAVLDWDGMVRLPVGEAIGYAAASLTHSWRAELYQPLTLDPVIRFLDGAPAHARLAARFACGIRLAEDGPNARVTLSTLEAVLGS